MYSSVLDDLSYPRAILDRFDASMVWY